MASTLTAEQACALRMQAQGLTGPDAGNGGKGDAGSRVAETARKCGGIQAQDLRASRLAVSARADDLRLAEVASACDAGRTVVRSWFMRGTLHLVAGTDAPWLTALLGPVTIARYRKRRAALGLDDRVCAAALEALPTVLSDGPLDRNTLMVALRARGVPVPGGQAVPHLLIYTACCGMIVRGPDRGPKPTYVMCPAEQQPDGQVPVSAAAAALARRYFAAFAPASAGDFSSWSGLPSRMCRAAIAELGDELTAVTVNGQQMWTPTDLLDNWLGHPEGRWRLLPAFDTYLVGYRDRDLLIPRSAAGSVYAGGGWIHPSVVRDGQVVGSWRLRLDRDAATADVMLFDANIPLEPLSGAVAEVGQFIGRPVSLRRTAGF